MTPVELEAIVGLIGRARHIVIGTAADPASRDGGARIASAWGGLVLATVTWPETAASWLRQARRFATPEPDVWVVSATPAGWSGMARRLRQSTSWSPHRTIVTAALTDLTPTDSTLADLTLADLTLADFRLPGVRGARADGSTWEA